MEKYLITKELVINGGLLRPGNILIFDVNGDERTSWSDVTENTATIACTSWMYNEIVKLYASGKYSEPYMKKTEG